MRRSLVLSAVVSVAVFALVLTAPVLALGGQPAPAPEKVVALTFDDGPSPYTSQIVATLGAKGVTATFFMIGRRAQENPAVAREVADGGFELGNHSMLHEHYIDWPPSDLRADLDLAQSAIANVTGRTPRWYKPPYMEWKGAFGKVLRRMDLGLCWPDCAPDDWAGTMSAQQIADDVCADVSPGTVIGLHDGSPDGLADRSATADSVGLIVDRLLAEGYTFVTLDQLQDPSPGMR